MKAAVLGATGFVGSALVPAVAERMDVVAISRRGDAPAVERVRPVAADALEPGFDKLAVAQKHGGQEVVLAAKMRVHRALGQAGPRRYAVHAASPVSGAPERFVGGVDDALTGLVGFPSHARASLRISIPASEFTHPARL